MAYCFFNLTFCPRHSGINAGLEVNMSEQVKIAKRALSESQAAIYINMSRSFLRQDRMNGLRSGRAPGPIYVKIGTRIRYLKDDLDDWLEANRVVRELRVDYS